MMINLEINTILKNKIDNIIFSDLSIKKKRIGLRKLRKEMTPWERKLWYCFLKDYEFRFQRQKMIGSYIVDFYCAKASLIIELDGGQHYHPEQEQKDKVRTKNIEALGLKIIRFSNRDIDTNFYGVCTVIDREVKERALPQSSPEGDDSSLREGAKA